jgi:hypothetical protein
MSSSCPSDDQLLRFISGDLDARRAEAMQAHVRDCPSCRDLVHGTNRAFHTYQTYADDPAEQPRWEGFEAALRNQHDTLLRRRHVKWLAARRWWSMAATVLIMVAAGAVWYRYTEVPLNAERVLSQAIAFEHQGAQPPAAVRFRRARMASASLSRSSSSDSFASGGASGGKGTEPETVVVARELTRRLAPYGFYPATALSATHFRNWRTAAGRRDDQLAWIGDGLIKVSTRTPDGPVREAEITVRISSYEPIAQTWRFADGYEATMERVTNESPASIESAAAVPTSVAPVVEPASALPPDLDLVELEARAALHRLGVPVGEAWVVRRAGSRVRMIGAVSSPALAESVMTYARGRAVDLRVRVEETDSVVSPIANAPGFQIWLEAAYADHQTRARFVPKASEGVERLRVLVDALAALSERYPLKLTTRLSPEAREALDALVTALYRDVAAAHAGVATQLAGLVPVSAPERVSRLPEDWRARVAVLETSVPQISSGLVTLFERVDLATVDDVRAAADEALRPPLEACARALHE